MNGHHQNMRIAAPGSANAQKADPANPIARKLVYNAYREMLSKKHADANVIVDNAPQELVTKDEGIGARVESMMRQQTELKGGNMNAGGPPPPPPPPPIPGIIPASRLPSELSSQGPNMNQPPAALASAMMKERKPFTYTPGGLDLSEIRSPRMQRRLYRNAQSEGVKPSPLAQQPQPGPPCSATTSQSAVQGLPVQVLPMPGVGMGPQQPQPHAKEPPKVKKSVCGPAPPPPPFVVTPENSFSMPVSSPISSIPSTISSPPISSSPTSPAAPQPQVAKDLGPSIPVAPPLPTQIFAARRGSLISASPPASPLVSTEPCEPSPPPLPPPQAVRVPVTPPILQEPLSPPSVPAKPPVIQASQTLTPVENSLPQADVSICQNEVPLHIEENDFMVPEVAKSLELPQSTSTPIENFILKGEQPAPASSPKPISNLIQEPSPPPEEPSSVMSPVYTDFPGVQHPFEKPVSLESALPPPISREPSVTMQKPRKEPSPPKNMTTADLTPLVIAKEPSPIRHAVNAVPSPTNQVNMKELSPVQQVAVKEPSPVIQAPKTSVVTEAPRVNKLPIREPSPIKQTNNKDPSPGPSVHFNGIPAVKQIPAGEPEPLEAELPVIFSPIPVKEMPLKEPTPVRQIVRDPTPVRQAILEKPVITEPASLASPPGQAAGASKQLITPGTAVMRQVPVQQAAVKRQSSLPEAPFLANTRMQQPAAVNQVPIKHTSSVNQFSLQKPISLEQIPMPQPIPIKPVPIKIVNEPVSHTIPVRMPSPPPNLAASSNLAISKGTKLVRQASLPTKPSSPQVSPPNTQLGYLYVPPLTGEELANAGPLSPSADRSPGRSPTTGLHKAPLPWMSAHRREPSPPPLFLQHAQQTFRRFQPQQNRFIRQSSLGPESSSQPLAQTVFTAQNNVHQPAGCQRQQSLPPPQRPLEQQQPQQQPVKVHQNHRAQPQQQPQPQYQAQPQYQQPQPQFQQPQPKYQQPQPQFQQPQPLNQPQHLNHHPQLRQQPSHMHSQPIRIQPPQTQPLLNQQPRIIPVQVQQTAQPKQKPRERIIPIMLESDSPPRETGPSAAPTMTSNAANSAVNERFIPIRIEGSGISNNAQHTFHQPQPHFQQNQRPLLQPQPTWTSSPGKGICHPATTLGGGQSGAFLPYNSSSQSSSSAENISKNNPLDALHQMQQSLAQLNSGLENAFPRFIQKKMSDTITPRTTPSNQPNQNGNGVDQADFGVPLQSRSFRVLQTVLDHQDTAEPQGPVHIPNMRQNVQQPSQQQPQPNQFQQQPVYQQHSGPYQQPGVNNAASVEQTVPEPKKYMGGNIPSRSFRMLQAMTASDDVAGPGQSDL